MIQSAKNNYILKYYFGPIFNIAKMSPLWTLCPYRWIRASSALWPIYWNHVQIDWADCSILWKRERTLCL